MKKTFQTLLAAGLVLAMGGCSAGSTASEEKEDVIHVTVVKQLDHASLDEIANAITDELDAAAKEKGIKIEYGEVQSGQNDASNLKTIFDGAVADKTDVIIPIATLAAQTAVTSTMNTDIPVVYAAVSDPEAADLTGLKNVTGTSDALDPDKIMDMMLAQNKDLKKVGLLYSKSETNSEKAIAEAKKYLDEKGISYEEKTGNTNDEVLAAVSSLIADKADAVFTPTDNVVMASEITVAQELTKAGIPHYAGADSFVTSGALATCGVNYKELGKKTADLAIEAAQKGTDDLDDFYTMDGGIITVNTETAEALGVDPDIYKDFGELNKVTTQKD